MQVENGDFICCEAVKRASRVLNSVELLRFLDSVSPRSSTGSSTGSSKDRIHVASAAEGKNTDKESMYSRFKGVRDKLSCYRLIFTSMSTLIAKAHACRHAHSGTQTGFQIQNGADKDERLEIPGEEKHMNHPLGQFREEKRRYTCIHVCLTNLKL